jgi:hypothetical protein
MHACHEICVGDGACRVGVAAGALADTVDSTGGGDGAPAQAATVPARSAVTRTEQRRDTAELPNETAQARTVPRGPMQVNASLGA